MYRKKRYVLIGGGHGLSTLLGGMKEFEHLTAIVDVTDSGGSTGKLRNKFDCPAMGDIRICLNSLGDAKLKDIFERRIKDYGDCVGNLIIASLIKLYDFNTAIKIMHKLLGLKDTHRIIPVSLEIFDIRGQYRNGKIVKTENEFIEEDKIEKVWLEPKSKINPEVIQVIKECDYVIIAPGSFYTSILVNFLLPEIATEINKKKIIWIINAMQQLGETIGMDANEHASVLLRYIDHIDYALINNTRPSEEELKKYNYEGYLMSLLHLDKNEKIKHIIEKDLIKYSSIGIIHSPNKVKRVLKEIIND
jgi:uncharacterized cofD-like protein